jgi:hypothetical protein
MSEIQKWLETIGLGEYGDAFEANQRWICSSTSMTRR